MPRQVYELSNSSDIDYLLLDPPAVNTETAPAAKKSKTTNKPAVKAARSASVTAALTKVRAAQPSIASAENNYDAADENDDEVKPGKGKKIAMKSVQEHQQLINQLNKFSSSARFGPVIKDCGIVLKDLRLKSVAELRELRERVRSCCANSGTAGGIVGSTILSACGGLESAAPARFMNLEGYREAVESNPEFASLCEMIEIDSTFLSTMSPMQKMVMCLGSTAMSVAAMNRHKRDAAQSTASLVDSLRAQQQQLLQQQQRNAQSGQPIEPVAKPSTKPVEEVRTY